MSQGSASYTCTWVSDKSTYTCKLMGTDRELVQMYTGSAADPDIATEHNWQTNPLVVDIMLMSSNALEDGQTVADKIIAGGTEWYLNDQKITFSNGISLDITGGPQIAGCFEIIPEKSTGDYADHKNGCLIIKKNLVTALGGINATLKVVVKMEEGTSAIGVTDSTPIRFVKVGSDATTAEIYCDNNDSMVLVSDLDDVTLKARLWSGINNVTATNGQYKKWYVYDNATAAWVAAGGTGGKGSLVNGNLKITGSEVDSFLQVMVAFFKTEADMNSGDISKAIATDMQTVADSSDALIVFPNPTPADGVLRAGETTPAGVSFNPTVKDKNSSTELSGFKFKFTCLSPAGTILNGTNAQIGSNINNGTAFDTNNNNTPDNTEDFYSGTLAGTQPLPYVVPRAMFEAIGCGPTVNIYAYKV